MAAILVVVGLVGKRPIAAAPEKGEEARIGAIS
jgi:hypothetical protein